MTPRNRWPRFHSLLALALCSVAGTALTTRFLSAQSAQAADAATKALEPGFEQIVQPFFKQNCVQCHNSEQSVAGVRVDQLDAKIEDRHIQTWESILRRVKGGTMPPKGLPQPSAADRDKMVAWLTQAIEVAKMRPAPKNGLVRRLTVSQYRNTLKELFQLDDDLTRALPPDAVSKDGFLNNKDTLQFSPLLTEAYFEIAEEALNRAIVDVKKKPVIQDFRMDLGTGVNPAPLPEKLIMGAGSQLLENADVLVTQPLPVKPFAFEPFVMRTKFRYIEGYRGNDTVRGWRDFDSIYHNVFADMRGSAGYPKGSAYGTVPRGLLLRPAIPNSEMFEEEGTYGPKANFKISVRDLPDGGRFRVTVTAAKYNDGLLLDPGVAPQAVGGQGAGGQAVGGIVVRDLKSASSVTVPKAGVYQVDVYGPDTKAPAPDATRLTEGLSGVWPTEGALAGKLEGKAKLSDSAVGKTVTFTGGADALVIPRNVIPIDDEKNVGEGDFSVAAWIRPTQMQRAGIVTLAGRNQGWYLELPDPRGTLRLQTMGQAEQANAMITTRPGTIRVNEWQHVAAVVRRGKNETLLYVNGNLVARSAMGTAQFDDVRADLHIGGIAGADGLKGDVADVRLYRRPLEEAEIQALIQPGKSLIKPVQETPRAPRRQQLPELTLTLGDRQFSGELKQPAFLAVRLEAGPLQLTAKYPGPRDLQRVVLTPLAPDSEPLKNFLAFEKRSPRVGVHLGLRRDCGSTFGPVGAPQTVAGEKLSKYVFEGAIRNFPAPEVEKNNVNYLAGMREIGVRSEYTDGRDMPRLLVRSVEFEGPVYDQWPPASHKSVFVDFDRKSDLPAYAKKIVHDFATKAYRRPVTDAEEAALLGVYVKSTAAGRSFEESVKDAVLVTLTSPQFLFLLENSATPAPEPLSAYELASKLSYFLWNSPPDQKTLQLAATGALPKVVDAEVDRMVADPKFARFTNEFTAQWLSLDKFQVLESDRRSSRS